MNSSRYIFFFSFCLVLFSCKKDEPALNNAPEIAFVSISPASATEFADEIKIIISYKDNDGDLGENNASVNNLFVRDSRNGIIYKFRVQQLAPSGSTISIKGNLDVVLNNTSITNGSTSENVNYTVYVTDRSGNKSNEVTTSSITITK